MRLLPGTPGRLLLRLVSLVSSSHFKASKRFFLMRGFVAGFVNLSWPRLLLYPVPVSSGNITPINSMAGGPAVHVYNASPPVCPPCPQMLASPLVLD